MPKRNTRRTRRQESFNKQNVVEFPTSNYSKRPNDRLNLEAKTPGQARFKDALDHRSLIMVTGPAGCGKTYMTMVTAAKMLKDKQIRKIILARPNVSTGPSLGAFPGEANDKLALWLAEPLDILKEVLGKGAVECMLKNGSLVLEPLEVIRGRSWDDAFILIDESQNLTMEELKAITTRLGEGSTMVIAGDATQADKRKGSEKGEDFERLARTLETADRIGNFEYLADGFASVMMTPDDIVRSGIVKDLVKLYYAAGI